MAREGEDRLREGGERGHEHARRQGEIHSLPDRGADPLGPPRPEILRDERGQVLTGAGEERDQGPDREEAGDRARHRFRGVPGEEQPVHEGLDREGHVAQDQRIGHEQDFAPSPRPLPALPQRGLAKRPA